MCTLFSITHSTFLNKCKECITKVLRGYILIATPMDWHYRLDLIYLTSFWSNLIIWQCASYLYIMTT